MRYRILQRSRSSWSSQNRHPGLSGQEWVGDNICPLHNNDDILSIVVVHATASDVASNIVDGWTQGPNVEGKRAVVAHLRFLDLVPGVYVTNLTCWDAPMEGAIIHLFDWDAFFFQELS